MRTGGWQGVEKWILKLTSAKVEVEVEAELGNKILIQLINKILTHTYIVRTFFRSDLISERKIHDTQKEY